MHEQHEIFLKAIHEKRKIALCFDSNEKGEITRQCICYDFGPSKRYRDNNDRYHFHDLDSPEGQHNLSILPSQIVSIEISEENFEPADYVTWTPISWYIKRDWGLYS